MTNSHTIERLKNDFKLSKPCIIKDLSDQYPGIVLTSQITSCKLTHFADKILNLSRNKRTSLKFKK